MNTCYICQGSDRLYPWQEHYVHQECAVFLNIKWLKSPLKAYGDLRRRTKPCCICRMTRTQVMVGCLSCDTYYHVECIISKRKPIHWDPTTGKILIYCKDHTNLKAQEVDWDKFDSIIQKCIEIRSEERHKQPSKPQSERTTLRRISHDLKNKPPTYELEYINNEPVYPDEDEKREEAMQAYWDAIDQSFFVAELPQEVLDMLQINYVQGPVTLEDHIPSVQLKTHFMNVVYRLGGQNFIIQYAPIVQQEPLSIEEEISQQIRIKDYKNQEIKITSNRNLMINESEPILTLKMANSSQISAYECNAVLDYQKFLIDKRSQYNNELDAEFSFLMRENDNIQDELEDLKRNLLKKIESNPLIVPPRGLDISDDIRYHQTIKYLINGFQQKNESILDCFKLTISEEYKKIMHLYPEGPQFLRIDCKVCFNHIDTISNQIVYCEKCDAAYHKWCYGIPEGLEDKGHLCDACVFNKGKGATPPSVMMCLICRQYYQGITVKQLRGNFFHPACLFICNLLQFNKRSLIIPKSIPWTKIELIIAQNSNIKCAVCMEIRGKKEKCTLCDNYLHLMCGYLYGSKIILSEEKPDQPDQVLPQLKIQVQCHSHHQKQLINNIFLRRFPINYRGAATTSDYWEKMDDPYMQNVIV